MWGPPIGGELDEKKKIVNLALELLSILAGLLTVLSPCILPILPALLSASVTTRLRHRPFWIVAGLASGFTLFGATFTLFGSFSGLSGTLLRQAAMVILFFFGVSLIWPRLWEKMGNRISALAQRLTGTSRLVREEGRLGSLLIGGSLGLIWAPCAGPILGIVITLATVQRSFGQTLLLMGGYALGASVPMLLIGYGGQRMSRKIQRFRSWGPIAHKALGSLTIVTVIGLHFHLDTLLLSRLPGRLFIASQIETMFLGEKDAALLPQASAQAASTESAPLPVLGRMPEFSRIAGWINSPALTSAGLRGKVVLVDFWTYSCINCIRTLPYITKWYEKYQDQGLIVVGVHTPEFSFEKEEANVKQATVRHGIRYPVALDNDYGTWNAYDNHYWPAHYLIDAQGRIREEHFGEGDYEETEKVIQTLLAEARLLHKPLNLELPRGSVDLSRIRSFETYIGYGRAHNFSSPKGIIPDAVMTYSAPGTLRLNQWAFTGSWRIGEESALLAAPGGTIQFRFAAPKLNLVMAGEGRGSEGKVFLDGRSIAQDLRGEDVGRDGRVRVTDSRLYNLVALPPGDEQDHLFELVFDQPHVSLFAFTFG